MLKRLWCNDEGVLTFEWILLLTLLVIGVIGGLAAIRDAIIHESQGTVGAMVSLDQDYFIEPPLGVGVDSMNPTANNCTSSSTYSSNFDSAFWSSGRLDQIKLNQINQEVHQTTVLCPLP